MPLAQDAHGPPVGFDLTTNNNKQGMTMKRLMFMTLAGAAGLALSGCHDKDHDDLTLNRVPDFIIGDIDYSRYDGITDDLLTAVAAVSRLLRVTALLFGLPRPIRLGKGAPVSGGDA